MVSTRPATTAAVGRLCGGSEWAGTPRRGLACNVATVAGAGAAVFRFGAFGIHQLPQADRDVAVGVVELIEMAIDGRSLGCSPTLLQLFAQGIQIAEYGGGGLAAFQFCEALLKIIEQPRCVGAWDCVGCRRGPGR